MLFVPVQPCSRRINSGIQIPETNANVVTTENSDWATNCPEYKVTAVEVVLVNHKDAWQKRAEEARSLPQPQRKRSRDPAPA